MTDKHAYSYTVLRYVHDVMTSEFVNVGVVLYTPASGTLYSRTRKTITRIRDIFPDLDRKAFTKAMRSIDRSVTHLNRELEKSPLLVEAGDALSIARRMMPSDDSSLQWSPVGVGISNDPSKTVERLYERLVGRYDERPDRRRTDDEIWRPVKQKLEENHLAWRLQEKTISGDVDEIVFKHAWKNGQWHVYEPVSLDLADADGIKEKARRWLGHLSAVAEGNRERFKPHFFVGAPQDASLMPAYETAIAILKKAPFGPEIFEENQIDDLVSQIENEVNYHNTGVPPVN
ncbi:MAG: DUF3037 domain-containing protein [Inquilinus limosus]|uniref:DUF3037 domain-containing protein n=1 Tax=Inquilinus limosus TaxID=171674 RepID=A0A952FTS9_9PROT|nr:DUF3037 domain-containing protein [Inquilinus limosus]